MRNRYQRLHFVLHFLGNLLLTLSVVLLLPLVLVLLHWGRLGDGWPTVWGFVMPSALSLLTGLLLKRAFRPRSADLTGSMLACSLSWIAVSLFGAFPFCLCADVGLLDAYFEAVSGFTTAGITILPRLEELPRSILFWRALCQWLGGIGILSFFLGVTFRGTGAHHLFGAESHKIASTRPVPGLHNTVRILWSIYLAFTLTGILLFYFEGMPMFEALCHGLTAVSTGGFSPFDSGVAHYAAAGHPNYRLIEYTFILLMIAGGVNFLLHYRALSGDLRAFWDNLEIRYFWRLLACFTLIVIFDHLHKTGALGRLADAPASVSTWAELEHVFRTSLFQVASLLTTAGFSTERLDSPFFPALSRQLFIAMMVIGGCVGSTSGGFKIMRTVILGRLMQREVFKLRVGRRASNVLVVGQQPVDVEESHRTAALFFAWMALVALGGGITALLSDLGPWESASGMFSALGNVGPSFISVEEMIELHPAVKATYMFGMLAGRLEILPVLLLLSRRAWR